MNKLSKEEKAFIKAYMDLRYVQGNGLLLEESQTLEYEASKVIGNLDSEHRDLVETFVNRYILQLIAKSPSN